MKKLSINGFPLFNSYGDVDVTSAGFRYAIDTMSYIRSKIIKQIFYEIAVGDYIPVDVGEAAWKSEIIQNGEYLVGGSFFDGEVDMGGSGVAKVDTALVPNRMPVRTWRKKTSWTIAEVAMAANAGNWDVVEGKMAALKKDWDLGVQQLGFLGRPGDTVMTGLLNNAEININTTLISAPISGLSAANFQTFVAAVLAAYMANANYTIFPDTFIMPMTDYLGMGAASSSDFPIGSKIDYLQKMFAQVTKNPNFQILPLAYSDSARNASAGISKNRYVLYRKNPDTLSLALPVDFTMVEPRTLNSFDWEQLAYGQFSGVLINRKREVLYIDETAAA